MAIVVNNKPNLEFSFLGGGLVARDYLEEYDGLNLTNYVCVDYVMYNNKIVNMNIIDITNAHDIETVSFTLANDGIHEYYRLVVPKIDKYLISGQVEPYNVFYYNNDFYYTTETILFNGIDTKLFKKIELDSLYKLLEEIGIDGSNEVIYNKYFVFSYELFKKSFVQMQKYIESSTSFSKNKISKEERQKRNILLMAIYTIEEYLTKGMLNEADALINTINESKCFNTISNNLDDKCGCSNIIVSV